MFIFLKYILLLLEYLSVKISLHLRNRPLLYNGHINDMSFYMLNNGHIIDKTKFWEGV